MKLSEMAKILGTSFRGEDCEVSAVNIDTRKLKPGELFVAIKTERLDGHDFIQDALGKKACAALVSHFVDVPIPQLLAEDPVKALGLLAQHHKKNLSVPTVAVTGSCGKTTTKTMMVSILSQCGLVHSNQGTFNNHLGVPLTLLSATKNHDYLVLELGANHGGEIAYLTHIAQPDVAMITNAAPCHLEGFGSLNGVAKGKGEIFQGLPPTGTAVLNRDDVYYEYWRSLVSSFQSISFGFHEEAMVRGKEVKGNEKGQFHFILSTPQGEKKISLPLLGIHHVHNALGAAASALALGIPLEAIQAGLEMVETNQKRLVVHELRKGIFLIDDTYNANPTSMRAAISLLKDYPGERVLVIGDMGELGAEGKFYHSEIGSFAKEVGIQRLYGVGPLCAEAVKAFGEGGMHFSDKALLSHALFQTLALGQTILVKGSRSAAMEQVVEALLQKNEELLKY